MYIFKIKIVLSFISIFLFSTYQAQLLWKISGQNLSKESYLFGTIHLVPKEKFVVKESIDNAFNSSEILALEIDLNMSLSDKINAAREMILPSNKKLSDYMSEEEFVKLKSYCRDTLHISKGKFNRYLRLKPFFFSAVLVQESIGKSKGYDTYFQKMANKKKIPLVGLEKLEDQLSLVNKLDMLEQIDALKESSSAELNEYYEMLDVYMKEDLNALEKLINNSESMDENFKENFLINRNKNWIPVIENLVQKKSSFIAVGAAHLLGDEGIIQLLKYKGYILTPILE